MSPVTHEDWSHEDEHFCAHCLTELDRWSVRCYRCDASFRGAGCHSLVAGRPDIASVLHHG
jgi:hypothetical protein